MPANAFKLVPWSVKNLEAPLSAADTIRMYDRGEARITNGNNVSPQRATSSKLTKVPPRI